MNRRQFRVLYREFLLRIVDLELLAPRGTSPNCWDSSPRY